MRRLPLLLAVLGLVLSGCVGASAATGCERLPGVRPGLCPIPVGDREPAPVVHAPALGDGDELSVADLAGRLVVVNFWGSWCGPCRVEQPELNAVAEQLGDEAAFLGVNVADSSADAQAYVREFGVAYPSVFDPAGSYAARFGGIGPRAIPSTIVIDPEGRVAVRIIGSTTATELVVLADHVLAGEG